MTETNISIEDNTAAQDSSESASNDQKTGEVNNQQTTKERLSVGLKKPRGYDPVDISDLSEEKQKQLNDRFSHYHKQVKELENRTRQYESRMAEWQENAAKQILDLTNGVTQIVDHIEDNTINNTEASIKNAMKQALESGDVSKYVEEQAKLISLQAKKLNTKKQPSVEKEEKQQQKQNQPEQQLSKGQLEYVNAVQVAHEAFNNGELTSDDAFYVEQWQNEKNENGEAKRPWAFDSAGGIPQPGSPMDRAMKELASIVISPSFSNKPIQDILSELDRRMGVKQPNYKNNQTVLSGSLTSHKNASSIKLSPEIEKVAIRMKFAGPGKTDAEHIAAYKKNAEKVLAKRRSQ